MGQRLSDYRLFLREFRQTFHSTGAILPSGRRLSRALACKVGCGDQGQRVLEVGAGTGAVTAQIVAKLGPEDRLDLVELNERFAEVLERRLQREESWQRVADRVRVLQMPVEELDQDRRYDVIVSGLPLNNFSCEVVEQILGQFHRLAARGASLSFFEYVAIRKAKALCAKTAERRRLTGIETILRRELDAWEVDRDCVLANVPPAWVHHLRLPGEKSQVAGQESRVVGSEVTPITDPGH
ncbi:MAG: methyltransferase domain-containing protein [Planctomycetales bacterium]|nr:methyltransferase domain-containing protein [Planctomycetales bacterium]